MSSNYSCQRLNDTVIANGFCVGCGGCTVPEQSPFKLYMDQYGQYQSKLDDSKVFAKTETNYEELCPFGSSALNENELAEEYYSEVDNHNSLVGYYKSIYAGYVIEGDFRSGGSSGGMGTWMLSELLEKGLVDYVVHIKSSGNRIPFDYGISNTLEQIQEGQKSRYYPIQLSEVLQTVREKPGRYAVVGLPCFIKSIRLLQAQNPIFSERIHFCVGLVCGHLKSAHYAESLAWQMGVEPSNLTEIDFRVKDVSQPANRYRTYVRGKNSGKSTPTNQLFGTDWGMGAFKYKACDFCDDVFSETADVVMGDAWLPEYVSDSYGTNIVITRNDIVNQLIDSACIEGRLKLADLPIDEAIQSQNAGLRHRKMGISERLKFESEVLGWVPKKRIPLLGKNLSQVERKKQLIRMKMRRLSHERFKQAKIDNDIDTYLSFMMAEYNHYKKFETSTKVRLKEKIKLFLLKLLTLVGFKKL